MYRSIISGSGQDSSYMAELLLGLNNPHKVIMFSKRNSSSSNNGNVKHLLNNPNFLFIDGDATDSTFLSRLILEYKPHNFYSMAAQSNVGYSFKNDQDTYKTNIESVSVQLSLINQFSKFTRFLFTSSSEMFGGVDCPKSGYVETDQFNPRSPYAISKVTGYYITKNYRDAYGLHASSSISFNHSSVRRGLDFATRKITNGVARVKSGKQKYVRMGDLSAFRDEGSAKDYCEGMYLMTQQTTPDDYILSTGVGATIEQMFRYVCSLADLRFEDIYQLDENFIRPSEVKYLLGNSSKANIKLNWYPKQTWKDLLKEMYIYDLATLYGAGSEVSMSFEKNGEVKVFVPDNKNKTAAENKITQYTVDDLVAETKKIEENKVDDNVPT